MYSIDFMLTDLCYRVVKSEILRQSMKYIYIYVCSDQILVVGNLIFCIDSLYSVILLLCIKWFSLQSDMLLRWSMQELWKDVQNGEINMILKIYYFTFQAYSYWIVAQISCLIFFFWSHFLQVWSFCDVSLPLYLKTDIQLFLFQISGTNELV